MTTTRIALARKTINKTQKQSFIATITALREYRKTIRYLSRSEIAQERTELFKVTNSDVFFPIKTWPEDMWMTFWQKPIGDVGTFTIMLFGLRNSCPSNLMLRWILRSQTWWPEKTEKQARQIDFILNNEDGKRSQWFYFDLDHGNLLYITTSRRFKCVFLKWLTTGCCSSKAQFIPLGIAFGSIWKRLKQFRFYSAWKRLDILQGDLKET